MNGLNSISPHPLDFDWRFDQSTIDRICSILPEGKVLAVGAPSIARRLECLGRDVVLIDRQPRQGACRHLVSDIDLLVDPIPGFRAAIVDPPWYPASFIRWVTYAASCLNAGGTVLVSAWPPSTRPGAREELKEALARISEWAKVERAPLDPTYEVPRFEQLAIEAGGAGPLSVSPRTGILLELTVRRQPGQLMPLQGSEIWQRFVIDGYQLALRLGGSNIVRPGLVRHARAVGWRWPFVSARAPGRSEIDLWSSDGEVALVASAASTAQVLRRALSSGERSGFDRELELLPELLSWNIPSPPYRSLIEWTHQQ
jgi:hypothetical protein